MRPDVTHELIEALKAAPSKYTIDFQPYWDWYDGPRAAALTRADSGPAPGVDPPKK